MITINITPPKQNSHIFEKLAMRQQVEDKMVDAMLSEHLKAVGMTRQDFQKMPYSYQKSIIRPLEDEAWHKVRQQPLDDWFVGQN